MTFDQFVYLSLVLGLLSSVVFGSIDYAKQCDAFYAGQAVVGGFVMGVAWFVTAPLLMLVGISICIGKIFRRYR